MKNIALLIMLLALTGCAGHYDLKSGDEYGFFSGLWHGIIFLPAAIINLISWLLQLFGITWLSDIQIVGRPNSGIFYYCGFIIGFLAVTSNSK